MNTYEQLKQNNKNLGLKEIAVLLREYLKKEFPSAKFSVTTRYYSGGCSLHISLMSSYHNIIRKYEDLSDMALFIKESNNRYSKEDIKNIQNKRHHQLNHFQVMETYDPNSWCNGVFLTERGHNAFKKVMQFLNQYHYDNSDTMTDYFDTNFYIHLNIGKWDKDYTYFKED